MKKLTLLFVVLMLAACGSDDSANDKPKLEKEAKPAPVAKLKTDDLICPQVAILKPAQEAFDYGGEKPDPSQLVGKARMKTIEGDCGYRPDGIDISFTLHMVAARGARLGTQISFPYFIAVVDPNENVLTRQTVTATFKFTSKDKAIADDEPLHVFLPLSETAQQAGPDYRVLVGFQLQKKQ